MKISILEGFSVNSGDLSFAPFEKLGDLTVHQFTLPQQVFDHVGDSQAIIINKTVMSREIMEKLPNVKYIGLLATGYNVVDIKAAEELGITVTFVPSYATRAVAQHTFALLLELTNLTQIHNIAVHDGEWSDPRRFCFWKSPLSELDGKTFGIFGYGRIGKATAEIARAMGMKVIFYNRSRVENTPDRQVSVEEVFKQSDVLSLHCPLTEQTREIVNATTLSLMKNSAYIINTSRGPVVNESDLAEALNSGKIAGAGLDVLVNEPPKPDCPLLKAKNCVITPHIAWAAYDARKRLVDAAAENLEAFINGHPQNIAK